MIGGSTFDPALDGKRLNAQQQAVFSLMSDGKWRSLYEIEEILVAYPVQSISARLRDFRKREFGSHQVLRRRASQGVFEYRLILAS